MSSRRPYALFDRADEVASDPLPAISGFPLLRRPKAPQRIRRQQLLPIATSVSLHLLAVLGLILHPVGTSFGAVGPDFGTGIPVALVAGFAEGGAELGPVASLAPEAEAERDELHREEAEPVDAGSKVPDEAKPQEDREATRPRSRLAMARFDNGTAAGEFEGAVGASASQGGDPTAASDLLGQIARCLPPGFRPRLGFSQLTLSVGPDGRLRAAPEVSSALPRISGADQSAADRIVQAALLCGPYAHPDALNRVITLAADFTGVEPAMVADRP